MAPVHLISLTQGASILHNSGWGCFVFAKAAKAGKLQGDLQCWFIQLIKQCFSPCYQADLLHCHTNQLVVFQY